MAFAEQPNLTSIAVLLQLPEYLNPVNYETLGKTVRSTGVNPTKLTAGEAVDGNGRADKANPDLDRCCKIPSASASERLFRKRQFGLKEVANTFSATRGSRLIHHPFILIFCPKFWQKK